MATTREERDPNGGLGAGGKFRKKPFRRPQSKPYDRPPIRSPTIVPGADGNSWLRKLMDPAHKLLASTARRFYASVFRKRLTQAPPSSPPPLQPPEAKLEAENKRESAIRLNISQEQEAAADGQKKPNFSSVLGERSSVDLEEILRQKTFTRSEIDRLTALLRAKVVSSPVEVEEKTPDVAPLKSNLFKEREEEVANIPMQDNGNESGRIPSRGIKSNVLDEDVASPAELAKAYMGSRPSKVSPSMQMSRSQALREDSTVLSGLVHPPKAPSLSLVPSSSGHVGVRENGYATPRSRGRSAIYSMARTPYSRVHVTSTLKSFGPMTNGYSGPSSATQALEHNGNSGSAKALKRSSSIFENDVGSGGPARRIRQKPNLLYQKNWSIPTSLAGELSSSSQQKQSVGEVGERSNAAAVSSRSTEMASKILQQLDKIVSPPKQRTSETKLALALEKAPAKLSPSKLHGQALKSLERIDSAKFLELVRDNDKPDDSVARFAHDAGENRKEKQDKIEQNGPSSIFAASDKLSPSLNGFGSSVFGKNDAVQISRMGDANLTSSLHIPVQKKSAFRMSAHEDYLDMDDDGYSNGVFSLVEVSDKPDTSAVEHKPSDAQAIITLGKHRTSTHDKPSINFFTKETTEQGAVGEKVITQTRADDSPNVQVASTSPRSNLLTTTYSNSDSDKRASMNDDAPLLSSGDEGGPAKEQNVFAPILGSVSTDEFTTNSADKASQLKFGTSSFGGLSNQKVSPDSRAQSSSSAVPAAGGLLSSSATIPESDKGEEKKLLEDRALSGAERKTSSFVSTTSSSPFTFGITSNGSTVPAPVSGDSNAVMSQKPFSIPSFPVAFSGNNSSNSLLSTTITASTSSPDPALTTFKFGSTPPNSVSSPAAAISEEAKTKAATGSGSIIASPLAAADSSSGSSIFGIGAASAISNANNQKGPVTGGAANGSAQVPEFPAAGTGLASFTQSVPVQFGSSSSSSPGLSTAVTAPSSSSLFGLSSAAKVFSSGTSLGAGALPSLQASPLSPSSSGLFGQATTTPVFASSMTSKSPTTGFSFSSSPSSSSGFVFGSAPGSSSAPSSAPMFGLSGTSPVFGTSLSSSSSAVTSLFGSTGSSSASTTAPFFGTGSASAAASIFGSSTVSSASSPFSGSMGASSGLTFSFTSASANPSSGGPFSFTSAASPSPAPVLGSSSSPFVFGSTSPANNNNTDQMSMEDSMAEDTVQANQSSTLPSPVFGQQQAVSPPTGFMFGSNSSANAPAGANPFQFGAQQNLPGPQSPSPFQASGSLDFNAGGGSFSLGTGGGDKSARKFIKVKNKARRK